MGVHMTKSKAAGLGISAYGLGSRKGREGSDSWGFGPLRRVIWSVASFRPVRPVYSGW